MYLSIPNLSIQSRFTPSANRTFPSGHLTCPNHLDFPLNLLSLGLPLFCDSYSILMGVQAPVVFLDFSPLSISSLPINKTSIPIFRICLHLTSSLPPLTVSARSYHHLLTGCLWFLLAMPSFYSHPCCTSLSMQHQMSQLGHSSAQTPDNVPLIRVHAIMYASPMSLT